VGAGERIFVQGDESRDLYLIRRGSVRLAMSVGKKDSYNLATFGRGDFFGEMAFLDGSPRSADALAMEPAQLLVLSRGRFDALAMQHQAIALALLEGLARILAMRLRFMDAELRAWRA
jgi:SulP family sulfate permease